MMRGFGKSLVYNSITTAVLLGGVVFGSELYFNPQSGTYPLYCPLSVDLVVNNPDTPISSIDAIMIFSTGEIENYSFVGLSSEYNSPLFNQYVYNSTLSSPTRKFGGTRLVDRPQNSTPKKVGSFQFTNRNLQTSVDLGLYALANTSAGDSNLGYNGQDRLTATGSSLLNFDFAPCTPDTQGPTFPNTNRSIANSATAVAPSTAFSFLATDQSATPANYRFQSFPLTLANYVIAPSQIDNQYGVDSGTLVVSIAGKDYVDSFELNGGNNFSSITPSGITRQRADKSYSVMVNPLHPFRIEEQITISLEAQDNIFGIKSSRNTGRTSLTFNRPQKPYVLRQTLPDRLPSASTLVDPNLERIRFRVEDSWAGVNSGTLVVKIFTGTASVPYTTPLAVYSGSQISLSGYSKTYINTLPGSQNVTHNNNFVVSLTGFAPLPENSYIWVITSGQDLAPWPNSFIGGQDRFSFQTRQVCSALQCGNGVLIYTGGILAGTELLYLQTGLYITGGYEPYLLGDTLFCNSPQYFSLDLYKNADAGSYGELSGGEVFLTGYSASELKLDIRGGTVELVGNTLYFTPTPPSCGNAVLNPGEQCDDGNTQNGDGCNASCIIESSGGGGGGGSGGGGGGGSVTTKDNCRLPYSHLPGANREGKDDSASYYDDTCLGNEVEDSDIIETPQCQIPSTYSNALLKSYKYACELGLIDEKALTDTPLLVPVTRIEVAKMLGEFAVTVFRREPDASRVCDFEDMKNYDSTAQNYAELVCQIGLMGVDFDGTPADNFNPNGQLTRGEFGTMFSRLLYGDKYNGDKEVRYRPHLSALNVAGIMHKIDEPFMLEQKGYVMLMLQRADTSKFVALHAYDQANPDNICSLGAYGEELEGAYLFACNQKMIDTPSIDQAELYGELKRIDLAKMLTIFSVHILGKSPDRTRVCAFSDTQNKNYEDQYYAQASCQLGLMGLKYNGAPDAIFNPDKTVTRAEFATVFSRLLRGGKYNGDANCRYCPHTQALKDNAIMTQIDNPTDRQELRGYAMLMMQRAKEILIDGM